MSKITEEILEVCAKSFFEDCKGDPDYPHTTWQEQATEFRDGLGKKVSETFLLHVYDINKRFYQN